MKQRLFLYAIYEVYCRKLSTLLVGVVALYVLSISSTAFAIDPAANPIAEQCSANTIRDQLSLQDYKDLLSYEPNANPANGSGNTTSNPNVVNITGSDANGIPLKIKMTLNISGSNNQTPTVNSFSSFGTNDNNSGIFLNQTLRNKAGEAQTTVTIEFFDSRDVSNNTPLYLDKVGLSVFDIDDATNAVFDDYVIITGTDKNGALVPAAFQDLRFTTLSEIDYGNFNGIGDGLYTTTPKNCTERSLDTTCQGSVGFNTPVKSVTIIYTNRTGRLPVNKNTTRQGMEFRLDNYCYAPPRVFSGIVFNDNGGADDSDANDRDASLSSARPIYGNASYFNGKFDEPAERGIIGSRIELVDSCTNPTTPPYATKELGAGDDGTYSFSVEQSDLGSQSSVCLIETGNTATPEPYTVRTTTDKITIPIIVDIFDYPDNNFGRVIAKNTALVLEKEQFAHDCNLTDLTDNTIAYTQNSISGSDIEPGECIAYKVIATNRAHIGVSDITIKDKLQERGIDGAQITSYLAAPTRTSAPASVGYTDGLNIGDNGEIKTAEFNLSQRSKQSFYFNTQYGSTQSNP